jgi:hypothetical protein
MGNERIPLKLFLDGKEITNFFTEDIQVIELDDENSSQLMKRFDFESTIELDAKQARRLVKGLVRAERKWKKEQWKQKFKGLFRNVTHLFKVK